MSAVGAGKLVTSHFRLKLRHAFYLETLSTRLEVSQSEVVRGILDERVASEVDVAEVATAGPLVRKHIALAEWHLDYIERLALKWGCGRDNAMRRVLNEARDEDPLALRANFTMGHTGT